MEKVTCNCNHCKYVRGEISKDYYIGFLEGTIENNTNILASLNYTTEHLKSIIEEDIKSKKEGLKCLLKMKI